MPIAITIAAAHETYQPYGMRMQIHPTSESRSGGRSAQSQMRASVALVGSCHVVQIPFLQPFHWMRYGFSCASVEHISAQKKSGIAMNDAIAHGAVPRERGTFTPASRPRARARGTGASAARAAT